MTTASNSNPRRLRIITSDEKIIEQIRSNNSASLYETIILEPGENENDLSNILVIMKLFILKIICSIL
jgi:hypothetical protein